MKEYYKERIILLQRTSDRCKTAHQINQNLCCFNANKSTQSNIKRGDVVQIQKIIQDGLEVFKWRVNYQTRNIDSPLCLIFFHLVCILILVFSSFFFYIFHLFLLLSSHIFLLPSHHLSRLS
jgi:hypothetical protein